MPNIVPFSPDDPLMQPVRYNGQEYFTSQYFHRQYQESAGLKGKYQRHHNFLKLLRSIEAYKLYIEQDDIVELTWGEMKEANPNRIQWQPLFHGTGYQPLTLLNATAQLALHQHLDDELSKQIAYTTNANGARQSRKPIEAHTPTELAKRDMVAFLEVARLLAVPTHIGQQEAVKMVEATHGVNFRPLLKAAPAQNAIPDDAQMLEPADLAKLLGMKDGAIVNKRLEAIGWQRKVGASWEPTPLGQPHAARHAWVAEHGRREGYNWKWNVLVVKRALQAR